MPFSDYSSTPGANTVIAGTSVAEGCPPGNLNDAIRQLMADGKALATQVAALSSGMPVSGGAFTGDISRSGKGAYLVWNATAQASGRVFIQASGGAAPAMADGDVLFEY